MSMRTGWRGFKWGNATQGIVGQIVYPTGADTVDFTTAVTQPPYGVLLNQPKQNETAQIWTPEVAMGPIAWVLANGTTDIALLDRLKTNATGRAIKATLAGANVATAFFIIGVAADAFTTDADGLIPVFWRPQEGNFA
jgi:hypothetical protein